jgi:outer membrane receptor protein involved in Fe transport
MSELEHGAASRGGWNWYLASTMFFENGWRETSPSAVRQFFGKFGRQGTKQSVSLALGFANNSLLGNGLQEERFLERDFASVYTKPDNTAHRAPWTNLQYRRALSPRWTFSTNAYYRYIRTRTLNGDINEESLDQSVYQPNAAERAALAAAGFTGVPTSGENAANTPFPKWRCIANVLRRDEPGEKCNGLLNRTGGIQRNYGLNAQASWIHGRHQVTLGGAYDGNSLSFVQSTELGYLNPDRSVTPLGAFADGVTGGDVDGEPLDNRVNLKGHVRSFGFFATDTWKLADPLFLTVSARYNHTRIDNRDQLNPAPGTGSLTGLHEFQRLNPGAGITYRLAPAVQTYFSYTEGSRAPSSIELGCADPASPCRLPNALAGDPPLEQVVTRTVEAGLRSSGEARWRWSAGWFQAANRNDILFVASEQTGFGYFKNFGRTRRQGLELDSNWQLGRLSFGAGYTYLDATFRSAEEVNGTGNSSNEDNVKGVPGREGTIEIAPGNRIPLTPSHLGKAYVDWQASSRVSFHFGVNAVSRMYARGNENNEHRPDGRYYLGAGETPAYAVANLGARWRVMKRAQLFAQVNNLFDKRYYSAAQLGPTGFTAQGNFVARPFPAVQGEFPVQQGTFFAPGAPRAAWVGLRYNF